MSSVSPLLRLDTLPPGRPRRSLGYDVLAWAHEWLVQPNGPKAGNPWLPTGRQVRFFLWWYAVDADGRWLFNHGVRRLAKGSGKALALDTPVPTPGGWSTMGALRPGDLVFGADGRPTEVVAATDVLTGRDCYRLTFNDGGRIVADADHLWPLLEFYGSRKRREVTITSADVAAAGVTYQRALTKGRTKASRDGVARFRTLVSPELSGQDVEFPIPPYLLGYWLGDGDSDQPRLTVGSADLDHVLGECQRLGIPASVGHDQGRAARVRLGSGGGRWRGWATGQLRKWSLLGDKHIPADLMRGSVGQRWELLAGLLDSDGTIDRNGKVELTVTRERLAADAVELMRSLGLSPKWAKSDAVLNGRRVGDRWRIWVTAYSDQPCFRLPRKRDRLADRPKGIPYSQVRTVTGIERVDSVPVRCITVAAADGLFLAGETLVPTHNSPNAAVGSLIEFLGPARVHDIDGDEVRGRPVDLPLVQIAAVSEAQTANTMRMVRAMASKGSRVAAEYQLDPGKMVYHRPDGGQLQVITSSVATAEGAEPTALTADETEHWIPSNGGVEFAEVLDRNLAKSGSRMLETSNAWEPGIGSVAESTWDAWVAQEEGRVKGDGRILYDALVADPATDLGDEQSLMGALEHVYGDCPWVDQSVIRDRIWSPRTPVDVSRRYYLNQPTAADDAWLAPNEWAACADASLQVADGDEITVGFDGSKSQDATAISGCRVSDGHVFTIGVWEPGPDEVVPVSEVDAAVAYAFDRWNVVAMLADVREWESFTKVSWPAAFADHLEVWAESASTRDPQPIAWDMRSHTMEFTKAVELTHAEILDRQFTHDGDSRVARHVGNARRRPNRWGVSIGKESRGSSRKIDSAVTMILARLARRRVLADRAKRPAADAGRKRTGQVFAW